MSTPCATGSQNLVNNGALADVEFVTVQLQQGNVAASVDRDVVVQFKRPHKFIMLVAIANPFKSASVFMHFFPLGLPVANGSSSITPVGTEQWIPLSDTQLVAADLCEGRWLKFGVPVQKFWIDADHSGHTGAENYFITFMGSSSIDFAQVVQS